MHVSLGGGVGTGTSKSVGGRAEAVCTTGLAFPSRGFFPGLFAEAVLPSCYESTPVQGNAAVEQVEGLVLTEGC